MLLKSTLLGMIPLKAELLAGYQNAGSECMTEAIARGLGCAANADLCELDRSSGLVHRPISEPAFHTRLYELSGVEAAPNALTAAAIRTVSDCLWGQNLEEGLIIAIARNIKAAREAMETAYQDRPTWESPLRFLRGETNDRRHGVERAFSMWAEPLGGNNFDVEVAFHDRSDDPVIIWANTDNGTIAKLIDCDLEAIRKVVREGGGEALKPPKHEELRRVQDPPTFDLGIFANGVGMQVWSGAVAVTCLDEAGNYRHRHICLIDPATFSRIERELRARGLSYVATAESVGLIEAAVQEACEMSPRFLRDWEGGAADSTAAPFTAAYRRNGAVLASVRPGAGLGGIPAAR